MLLTPTPGAWLQEQTPRVGRTVPARSNERVVADEGDDSRALSGSGTRVHWRPSSHTPRGGPTRRATKVEGPETCTIALSSTLSLRSFSCPVRGGSVAWLTNFGKRIDCRSSQPGGLGFQATEQALRATRLSVSSCFLADPRPQSTMVGDRRGGPGLAALQSGTRGPRPRWLPSRRRRRSPARCRSTPGSPRYRRGRRSGRCCCRSTNSGRGHRRAGCPSCRRIARRYDRPAFARPTPPTTRAGHRTHPDASAFVRVQWPRNMRRGSPVVKVRHFDCVYGARQTAPMGSSSSSTQNR